jgi:hypothetical protein
MTAIISSGLIVPIIGFLFFFLAFVAFWLSYYIPWYIAYMLHSFSFAFICLELVWYRAERYLEQNEARDRNFPAFRRIDTQYWRKSMFYPMALTLFTTRMIISLGALLVLGTFLNIINIGQDISKPFTGLRGVICRNFY